MDETHNTPEDESGFDAGAAAERLTRPPPQETIDEVEKERERRLAPENRPENTEIDNTDTTLPTVQASNQADREAADPAASTSDPADTFRENPPSEAEQKEIEKERERRLATENRPENTQIDNTDKPIPQDPE